MNGRGWRAISATGSREGEEDDVEKEEKDHGR